jgi:hypothetical protein
VSRTTSDFYVARSVVTTYLLPRMPSSDTGFRIFMALLGCYFVGTLVWAIRGLVKAAKSAPKTKARTKADYSDFKLGWSSYRAARKNGASIEDALRFATDEVTTFQNTGRIPHDPPPGAEPVTIVIADERRTDFASLAQTVLVNGITIGGVFALRWPVGTALALYWSETALATLLMFALLLLWRRGRPAESRGGATGEWILAATVFSAAHFVFILLVVGLLLPGYAASERFDRSTFTLGLLWIAIILLVDFAVHAVRIRDASELDLQRLAETDMQRVAILHLTIVFGMMAMAIIGSPRALFGVFSALKVLVDLTRRVRPG